MARPGLNLKLSICDAVLYTHTAQNIAILVLLLSLLPLALIQSGDIIAGTINDVFEYIVMMMIPCICVDNDRDDDNDD